MLKSSYCILRNKTPEQLSQLGEDPKEPGGTFIITGTEKVVLLQEQLSVNKIFLMKTNPKELPVARMTANTPRGTALIELCLDSKTGSVIKMRFPSMRNSNKDNQSRGKSGKKQAKSRSINALRLYRIIGIPDIPGEENMSERERIQRMISKFISSDTDTKKNIGERSMLKLSRNLIDFAMRTDDREIIANKMDKGNLSDADKDAEVKRILETDFFPHLSDFQGPDGETIEENRNRIKMSKLNLLSIMIAQFLEYLAGFRQLDDRDSWSNKRVGGAGRMMEQLFRNAWRKSLGLVQTDIDTGKVTSIKNVAIKIRHNIVTETIRE